jgi:hypothetical protein
VIDQAQASGTGYPGVSCPTTTFCMAVDGAGDAIEYANGSWSSPVQLDDDVDVFAVSCASPSFCMAVGPEIAWRFDGSSWTSMGQVDTNAAATAYLESVSCPSVSFCMAVDNQGYEVTYEGGAWSSPVALGLNNGGAEQDFDSVSCTSASFCVAVNSGGAALVDQGGTWSKPVSTGTGAIVTRSLVSCPATTWCMLFDEGAGAITWDGSGWSSPVSLEPPTVLGGPRDDLTALSCPTTSWCMGLDGDGRALRFSTRS